jgi:hypothetical protein
MPEPDHFTRGPLPIAVDNIEHGVHFLDSSLTLPHLTDLNWREAALYLRRLREARQRLHALESALETHIEGGFRREGLRPRYGVAVEGVGMVEVDRPWSRKAWNHQAVAKDLIDTHMADRGGEQPDPYEVRDWIMEAAGVAYWRVTPIRDAGLDPDDYCVKERGVPTVKIT